MAPRKPTLGFAVLLAGWFALSTVAPFAASKANAQVRSDFEHAARANSIRAFVVYGVPPEPTGCCGVERAQGVSPDRRDANRSEWATFDKLQHVTFSFLFTLGAQYTLENKLNVSAGSATPFSAASGVSIGVLKELYDRRFGRSKKFDFKDLVADLVGVAIATGLILI